MSLKLIREATLRATLTDADLKALTTLRDAIGATSIVDIVNEAFTPSRDDYDAWMRVVVGEAQDRGVNLNSKAEFMKLVMAVLEDDPAMPPLEMQSIIAKKLWQDYNAAKEEVRINKIAQAKEEEEKVDAARKQIADRFAKGPTTTPVMPGASDEEESGFAQAMKTAIGMEDEQEWFDLRGVPDPNGAYDAAGNYYRERDNFEDEEPSFVNDAIRDSAPALKGSFLSHLRGEDDTTNRDEPDVEIEFGPDGIEGIDDDEVFTSADDECDCPCADDTETDIDSDINGDVEGDIDPDADNMGPLEDELDDETMDDVDADVSRSKEKVYDEEEAVKSFFRQAATAPRDLMNQAVKDIEAEGKAAWKKANVPSNPHPQKSQAYRAWQKGMTAAAKEALGIADRPANPKAKAKPKRKK